MEFQFQALITRVACTLAVVICCSAFAETEVKAPAVGVKPFKAWREAEILRAQNELLRLNNKVYREKTRTSPQLEEPVLQKLEGQLKAAEQNLQFAQDLSLEDYVSVYLVPLAQRADFQKQVAPSLSKEELLEIVAVTLRRGDLAGQSGPLPPDVN